MVTGPGARPASEVDTFGYVHGEQAKPPNPGARPCFRFADDVPSLRLIRVPIVFAFSRSVSDGEEVGVMFATLEMGWRIWQARWWPVPANGASPATEAARNLDFRGALPECFRHSMH
ncbi:hypothetical protein LBMAG56_18680 [Verrucomicrobiota bacterium]|nr:hypothetical protein LBMAG56_18680 [Verrucomicrobiota bacterium]